MASGAGLPSLRCASIAKSIIMMAFFLTIPTSMMMPTKAYMLSSMLNAHKVTSAPSPAVGSPERSLKRLRRTGESRVQRGRHLQLQRRLLDHVDRLGQRQVRLQVERKRDGGQLAEVAHAPRADAISQLRHRVERHQRPARGAHVEHRQCRGIALIPRLELEDHPVLVGRGIDVRYLARAVGIGERRFDLLGVDSEGGGPLAVDLDVDLRPGDLQVARDIEQSRKGLELLLDDRHPMVDLFRARALNHILVLTLVELPADTARRYVLDEDLDAQHIGEL